MNTFYNEKAVHEIMRLEKEYSGLEMLTVNDPHWMFWKKNTFERWIENITQSDKARQDLLTAFEDYQRHSRALALDGKKCFKIILNLRTFERFLIRIDLSEAREVIIDMLKFLEVKNFHLFFYKGPEEEIEESEIISRRMDETENTADNLCVGIRQSRTDQDTPHFFLDFDDTREVILHHIAKFNDYRRLCLEQYRDHFPELYPSLREKDVNDYSEIEIKRVTKHILEQLLTSRQLLEETS